MPTNSEWYNSIVLNSITKEAIFVNFLFVALIFFSFSSVVHISVSPATKTMSQPII